EWITVVGVVTDIRHFDPERPASPAAYVPLAVVSAYGWIPEMEILSLVVDSKVSAEALVRPLKAAIRAVDPAQPVAGLQTLDDMLYAIGARRRFNTLLITTFAVLGVLLIMTGIYALMSTFVTQRRRDIGVHMALGASSRGVLALVLRQGTWLLAAGVGCGLAAVLALTGLLEGLLYAVRPTEPLVLVAGVALVSLVALAGSWFPALRATRIDPATALKAES
ncbi:MAG: ABC transporter permease, partial [bacterium]|nr:ABC transporter permease [bacterium]